ncbi:MAG TPA: 6-phosphogluconolactonase [Candidatus Acidoferrales bacterium]|nr:6-phosphogluconolactonase [Candidatus Acidoferrales bacterium]
MSAAFPGVVVLEDAAAVAREGAARFVALARAACAARGAFHVALSGGKTPAALFRMLAAEDLRRSVDWNKTHLYWSDERTVPPSHPDSNYGMAERELIAPLHIPAQNVHRMEAERADADRAAQEYEALLRKTLPAGPGGFPCFDLIYLGMGPDGHTASLFPGSSGLTETLKAVIVHDVVPPNFPPCKRMTFTFPLLNAARVVIFLVTGADKTEKLREVLDGSHTPPYPSQGVRPSAGERIFLVDRAAAGGLSAGAGARPRT